MSGKRWGAGRLPRGRYLAGLVAKVFFCIVCVRCEMNPYGHIARYCLDLEMLRVCTMPSGKKMILLIAIRSHVALV